MADKKYLPIISHYEACLDKFGDTHLGVDWPNQPDAETRYRVMLEVIRTNDLSPVSLLDFGCGASHMYEYMQRHNYKDINYSGLDLSQKFVELSRAKFPSIPYYCMDILDDSPSLPNFDYIVMNGVFTEKRELTFDNMWAYFKQVITEAFRKTNKGIAFNAMSTQVDWMRDDLFHLPMDMLASFLVKELSRDFVIRNDYRLYEFTTYVYKR